LLSIGGRHEEFIRSSVGSGSGSGRCYPGHPTSDCGDADFGGLLWRQLLTESISFAPGNVVLAVFNLFPLPPLHGGSILVGILPKPAAMVVARLEPFGLVI
jgi:hypothetical protein